MKIMILMMMTLFLVEFGQCDINEDRAKCGDELMAVATCLPYVSDAAIMPAPDCCGGFKEVLDQSPTCFCLLIKDRNDPSLGLQINVTRALTLPQVCKVVTKASITDCPAALHLAPNSTEAQIFTQIGDTKTNSTAPTDSTDKGKISNSTTPSPVSSGSLTSDNAKPSSALKVETTPLGVFTAMVVAARIFLAYT